jgi:hypothetical protein
MGKQEDHHPESEDPESTSFVVKRRQREVLNHFGSCPECGYPTQAFLIATFYADGRSVVTTRGTPPLPCGWSGSIDIAKMTTGSRRG